MKNNAPSPLFFYQVSRFPCIFKILISENRHKQKPPACGSGIPEQVRSLWQKNVFQLAFPQLSPKSPPAKEHYQHLLCLPTAKDSQAPHSSASLSTDSLILVYTLPEKHLRACTPPQVFLLKAIINHLPFVSRLSTYFANVFSLSHPGFRVERRLL